MELYDKNGNRIYLYEIYGFEESQSYFSDRYVTQQEIEEVVIQYYEDQRKAFIFDNNWRNQDRIQKLYDKNRFDEIERIEEEENILEKVQEIEGLSLSDRLYQRFNMLPLKYDAAVAESPHCMNAFTLMAQEQDEK